MKLATSFKRGLEFKPDEYNIEFTKDSKYDKLEHFLDEHEKVRVNVHFEICDLEKLKFLFKHFNNFYLRIKNNNISIVNILADVPQSRYFFDWTLGPFNYTSLHFLCETVGVTDIYIMEDLCYNLEEVKNYCNNHNIKTRLVLNELPTLLPDKIENTPFFLPQDYDIIDEYIDTAEFSDLGTDALNTLRNVWFEKRFWKDDIAYLFPTFESIQGRYITPRLVNRRIRCKLHCLTNTGSLCKSCTRGIELARKAETNEEYRKLI